MYVELSNNDYNLIAVHEFRVTILYYVCLDFTLLFTKTGYETNSLSILQALYINVIGRHKAMR